jgi:hypothetical protein
MLYVRLMKLTRILILLGSLFFLSEFLLHFLGLPILEHDIIFMITHDRYIAILALTYSILLYFISANLKKYKQLFILTMLGIFLMMLNAAWIAFNGGYSSFFPTLTLDGSLSIMGIFVYAWYGLTWICWSRKI